MLIERDVIDSGLSCDGPSCALYLDRETCPDPHDDPYKRFLDEGWRLVLREDGRWSCLHGDGTG